LTANGTVVVGSEPLVYERFGPHSYFRDMAIYADRRDNDAGARLWRHGVEVQDWVKRNEKRARESAATLGLETRLNVTRADAAGGYASPPIWLMDDIALMPRPHRVLAKLMPQFPLPQGVGEVSLPRITTGVLTGVQNDSTAVSSRDIIDTFTTSAVTTIAGESEMSLQLLEQSPAGGYLDHVIFQDLAASYDFQLERQLLNGTGAGGQLLGLLNVTAGTNLASEVTYTDASPTVLELMPFAGQAAAQLGNARLLPPEAWMMRTSRWAWINFAAWPSPQTKTLMDYPVLENNSIPATLGAASNQDAIIVCRPSDMLLLETAPKTLVDFESASGAMGVRLSLRAYVAAFVGRQPTAIARIIGTGLIVQSGF
jgi:HK97 family phage major capsid protein